MRICIDYGHCIKGYDRGAYSGNNYEEILTRIVGKQVKEILEGNGNVVFETVNNEIFSSVRESLNYRCRKANNQQIDLFISIHFNCYNFKAYGTEVYTYKGNRNKYSEQILNNICKLGFTNRGIKDGTRFAVIKGTVAPSILIECCFLDNESDMNRFDSRKMAEAIAYGVMLKEKPAEVKKVIHEIKVEDKNKIVNQVINGDWGNGQERIDRLRKSMYDPAEIQKMVDLQLKNETKVVKPISKVVDEVINGDWGNGQDRVNRLKKEGYNPFEIQLLVNRKLRG